MTAIPSAIRLDKSKTVLLLDYEQEQYSLSAEYLRVYSPSAEVRGHGVGQEVLQVGKRAVRIVGVEAVGNYALRIVFSDGHDSGLYDWAYLHELAENEPEKWSQYLQRLTAAGASRDA